jgi:diguanylate cyclase
VLLRSDAVQDYQLQKASEFRIKFLGQTAVYLSMMTNASDTAASKQSILRRIGLGGWRDRRRLDQSAAVDAGVFSERMLQVRRELVGTISAFLLDHDLEISPSNLVVAHAAFSGSNPRLARIVAARMQSGDEVTQDWLSEVSRDNAGDQKQADLEKIMSKLQASLDSFHTHTSVTRSAASEYGSKLEQHVSDLEQVQDTGQIVSNLAELARSMLTRTRRAEQEMRKSEDEAKALRNSLAKAQRDAELDHLTGLPNRRAFETTFAREYQEARVAMEPLNVAFCDIDHFKRVNDEHGHATGDRVIKIVADQLRQISDDKCHVARHGGEEFVVLFRGLSLNSAQATLNESREQLASRCLVNRKTDQPIGKVTFSAGLADAFAYPTMRASLIAADEALYKAKAAGRNCIIIAQ